MRKTLFQVILLGLLLGMGSTSWSTGLASAAEASPQIKDIIGKKTFLMEDGTMWSVTYGKEVFRIPGNVVSIQGTEYDGSGVTRDGKLIEWGLGITPHVVKGQSGVKQVAGYNWLKTDGTVWDFRGKVKGLDNISLIGYGDQGFAALAKNGDLLFRDPHKSDVYKTVGTISDAVSVTDLAVYDGRFALLYDDGRVVVYEMANFDDNGKVIPVTITEDAVHIVYTEGEPTDQLIVTLKDGTVWTTGDYKERWKLTHHMSGLNNIERTAALDTSEKFYAKQKSGTWLLYDDGDIKPVDVPRVKKLDVSLSDLKPYVGDKLNVSIQETYTNGAKIKVPASQVRIEVQKPQLIQQQSNGTLKVLGVGETQVTITSSGVSKTVSVSASLRNNLKYAQQMDGTVFVPADLVFKALGGKVSSSGGNIEVELGETSLSFKAGSTQAKLNGKTVKLKAAPKNDKQGVLVPVSMLSNLLGAQTQWDSKFQHAKVSFGKASMTIVSAETASLVKKAAQGSLSKYVGKSYWVNYYEDWERFSKVTILDIVPDDTGYFTILFKSGGKTLKSYSMSSSSVSELLRDESSFYTFDPYKKYKWSAATWKLIKAEKVVLDMTKDQVRMSIGDPASKSVMSMDGIVFDTWTYSSYGTVSFINGKVFLIML